MKPTEQTIQQLARKLFPGGAQGVNATRLVVRAIELQIIDIDNLHADEA